MQTSDATMNEREELVEGGFTSVIDAAEFLDVSRTTLYQLMDTGKLRYAKIGKCRRIPRRELLKFAAESMVGR